MLRWQLGIRLQNICKKTNKQRNNNNNKDSLERYLVCCLQWSEGDAKKLQSEPARSRTWNLLIRSQMRYPLRHWPTSCWVLCFHKSCLFWTFQWPELLFNYVHFIERQSTGCQPFPGSLVFRIRHSHRRGPGSISSQGKAFCPLTADREIKL